jgi:pyruvate/2-oxoglutarate dehydrogenase complex dihydrolipoamide dehydrogenase (E3) component
MTRYDAIVIGTGQAGPSLAKRLAKEGWNVAIIERGLLGGTCVNTGCTPTKTLAASAEVAHVARRAAEFGIAIEGSIKVDMKRVKARKDVVVAQWRKGVEAGLDIKNCTLYRGQARFIASHDVQIGTEVLSAEHIFINVGARASTAMSGIDEVEYLTNSSMMDIDFIPPHLVIVGGSYVGLEFAQMYRRFGSEVTVVEMAPRLIAREDEDISAAILGILEGEGIRVRLNAKCLSLAKGGEGIVVTLDCIDGAPTAAGTHLLIAAGRRPNTDDLGLAEAGIAHDERGFITVDDQLRTNVQGVWALGDCNGKGAFTHTSYNDFEIVAANLLDNVPRRVSDRITAYALYIDPPLGRAGMTEAEVRKAGRSALIGKMAMSDIGRAIEKGETQGLMKVIVDAETRHILGAAVLGTGGDEIIHCILDLIYAKAPYSVMERAVHIHPTISELLPTLLGELAPL